MNLDATSLQELYDRLRFEGWSGTQQRLRQLLVHAQRDTSVNQFVMVLQEAVQARAPNSQDRLMPFVQEIHEIAAACGLAEYSPKEPQGPTLTVSGVLRERPTLIRWTVCAPTEFCMAQRSCVLSIQTQVGTKSAERVVTFEDTEKAQTW